MLAPLFPLLLAAAPAPPDVGTVRDLRALTAADVQAGRGVRLTGAVTFCPPREKYFYLQDATGGVRVEWIADRELRPGDEVEVVGRATPGHYLPEVHAEKVTIKGKAV